MSRKTDLERNIRESYKLVREYEEKLRLSDDPKERVRCKKEIAEQRKLIKGYVQEYARLVVVLRLPVPDDIPPIVTTMGMVLPTEADRSTDQSSLPIQSTTIPPPAVAHALIVGVAAYRRISPLAKSTTDAQDLHDLLIRNGSAAGNCTRLLDGQATKGAIGDALDGLARRVGPDDTVVIFFSGHGAQRIGGFEPGEYLCPVEADWFNLRGTAISNEEFTTALRAIHAGRLLVLLDACHAGGVGQPRDLQTELRAGLSDAAYTQMAAGKGRVVIASCRPDESSWELPGMRNGLFTHYLLEGLVGGAARADGGVRVFDLFEYVSQRVPQHISQHPLFKGEMDLNFVVAIVGPVNVEVNR